VVQDERDPADESRLTTIRGAVAFRPDRAPVGEFTTARRSILRERGAPV